MKCTTCDDVGWVCENHPERPWDGPCPVCNGPAEGDVPRMPEGFRVEIDKDGWRH